MTAMVDYHQKALLEGERSRSRQIVVVHPPNISLELPSEQPCCKSNIYPMFSDKWMTNLRAKYPTYHKNLDSILSTKSTFLFRPGFFAALLAAWRCNFPRVSSQCRASCRTAGKCLKVLWFICEVGSPWQPVTCNLYNNRSWMLARAWRPYANSKGSRLVKPQAILPDHGTIQKRLQLCSTQSCGQDSKLL